MINKRHQILIENYTKFEVATFTKNKRSYCVKKMYVQESYNILVDHGIQT